MRKNDLKREFALLAMLFLLALGVAAQDMGKRFNASFKNTPLSAALKTIGKQSGVRVQFAYEDVKGYNVTAELKQVNAEDAVQAVIQNRPLTYKVVGGKFIIVSKKTLEPMPRPAPNGQKWQRLPNISTAMHSKSSAAKR